MHVRAISPLAVPLVCLVGVACSAEGGGAAGAAGTGDSGSTSGAETEGSGPSSGAATESGDATAGDSTDGQDTDDPPGLPDPYRGVWCGNASTGRLEIGDLSSTLAFAGTHDGPSAFAGWVTDAGEVQVAVYDVEASSWSTATTLEENSPVFQANQRATGAADGQGNALVAHVGNLAPYQVRAHAYDAVSGSWTATDLPGTFVSPRIGTLSMAATGHAVLSVYDNVGPVQQTAVTTWFLDPATGQWSGPTTGASVDQLFSRDTLKFAHDIETGAAALAQSQDAGLILIHNREATGQTTTTEVSTPASAVEVVSIGNGQFMLLSRIGGFQETTEYFAHYYDGAQWQAPQTIATGFNMGLPRLTGSPDGRAVASWQGAGSGTYTRMFGPDGEWGETLEANPPTAGPQTWDDHLLALDSEGYFVAWSSVGNGGIRTSARYRGAADWGATTELDPAQPSPFTRIDWLHSLGVERARAVWLRDSDPSPQGYVYACHAPMSGWSVPIPTLERIRRVEDRSDGEVLVMGTYAGGGGYAEYFGAR